MIQELDNNLVLSGDVLYTKRKSDQQLAPQPADVMLNVCGAPGVEAGAACITLDSAMTAGGVEADDTGRVNYRRRTTDAGPRIYSQDTDTFRISAALAGEFDINTGMNWDIAYTYGKNKADSSVDNSINATNLKQSVYANQDAWFTGVPLTGDIVNDISFTDNANGGNEQHVVSAG